jgi:DNA-directed RNA polymerase specialized sigma24 family protein
MAKVASIGSGAPRGVGQPRPDSSATSTGRGSTGSITPSHPDASDATPALVRPVSATPWAELKAMPPSTREAAARVVLTDCTFAEVARQLGTTDRAVERRLYRYRTEVNRRRQNREGRS